jgi:hypothetical protein
MVGSVRRCELRLVVGSARDVKTRNANYTDCANVFIREIRGIRKFVFQVFMVLSCLPRSRLRLEIRRGSGTARVSRVEGEARILGAPGAGEERL